LEIGANLAKQQVKEPPVDRGKEMQQGIIYKINGCNQGQQLGCNLCLVVLCVKLYLLSYD